MVLRVLRYWLLFYMWVFSAAIFAFELDSMEIEKFAREMSKEYDFKKTEVERILRAGLGSEKIIELMSRPAEKTKSWEDYKSIFVTAGRVSKGCQFWKSNHKALNKALRAYGVPPSIVTSIIGIETIYGANTGSHRLLDSLPTLAFHYPGGRKKRKKFFRYQLKEFFLLAREEGLDMETFKGSYAGAIGMPQFMPNNYRQLAVDFDGDGVKNILGSASDSIGSVANYLSHHGWRSDQLVYLGAVLKRGQTLTIPKNVGRINETLEGIQALDFNSLGLSKTTPAAVLSFKEGGSNRYWVAFENFYVLFRYNPRVKYALVVALLATALEKECNIDSSLTR